MKQNHPPVLPSRTPFGGKALIAIQPHQVRLEARRPPLRLDREGLRLPIEEGGERGSPRSAEGHGFQEPQRSLLSPEQAHRNGACETGPIRRLRGGEEGGRQRTGALPPPRLRHCASLRLL